MWAFKPLWDKGLLYEGYRVLPYCWGCETPLSNFETRLDDAYRERQDPARHRAASSSTTGRAALLVWTTTPWTLPSQPRPRRRPRHRLRRLRGGRRSGYVLAEARARRTTPSELATSAAVVAHAQGHRARRPHLHAAVPLLRRHARTPSASSPPTSSRPRTAPASCTWRPASARTTSASRGRRHRRSSCRSTSRAGSPPRCRRYAGPAGLRGQPADHPRPQGAPAASSCATRPTSHNYPHCWRTDTPLIYKAVSSLVRPGHRVQGPHGRAQPADPLGARAHPRRLVRQVARERPRLVDQPQPLLGLRRSRSGRATTRPTRASTSTAASTSSSATSACARPTCTGPFVDELVRPNPDDPTGQSMMRRVPEVLDCWFESGSMPFAQVHYPFENTDWFEHHFPGDFIVEYIGQTRGWFYTLHVLATALFDRPAFRTCVGHGILLGDDGRSCRSACGTTPTPRGLRHRRLRRDALVPDVVAGPARRRPRRHRAGHPGRRPPGAHADLERLVLPLALRQRRRRPGYEAASAHRLDRRPRPLRAGQDRTTWSPTSPRSSTPTTSPAPAEPSASSSTSSRTGTSAAAATASGHGGSRTTRATPSTPSTRCSRRCAAVAAPLLPLTTEEICRGLTGGAQRAPARLAVGDDLPADADLVAAWTRPARSARRRSPLRKAQGLRVRQPLPALTVAAPSPPSSRPFPDLVADEVNVKSVRLLGLDDAEATPARRHAAAHRQRPGRGPAPGQGRPGRHPGEQDRRLGGRPGRRREVRRGRAGGGRVHAGDRGGRWRRRGRGGGRAAERRLRRPRPRR